MKLIDLHEQQIDIESILKKLGITNYKIRDGIVDVDGDVDIRNKKLKKIPVQFGVVTGNFYCGNDNLTSGCASLARMARAPKSLEPVP